MTDNRFSRNKPTLDERAVNSSKSALSFCWLRQFEQIIKIVSHGNIDKKWATLPKKLQYETLPCFANFLLLKISLHEGTITICACFFSSDAVKKFAMRHHWFSILLARACYNLYLHQVK